MYNQYIERFALGHAKGGCQVGSEDPGIKRTHRILTFEIVATPNFSLGFAAVEELACDDGNGYPNYDECGCDIDEQYKQLGEDRWELVIGDMVMEKWRRSRAKLGL